MKLPDYITKDEVKRVCKELKIRDWTKLRNANVQPKEAKILLAFVNTEKMAIGPNSFASVLKLS